MVYTYMCVERVIWPHIHILPIFSSYSHKPLNYKNSKIREVYLCENKNLETSQNVLQLRRNFTYTFYFNLARAHAHFLQDIPLSRVCICCIGQHPKLEIKFANRILNIC